MYQLDLSALASQLIPPFLRQTKMLAWFRVLLSGLASANADLVAYRNQTMLELTYNGQTMVLQRALNLTFNSGVDYAAALAGNDYTGCILVDNTTTAKPDVGYSYFWDERQGDSGTAYFESEGNGPVGYTYFASEYGSEYDFIVKVPAALTYDANLVTAFVNKYKCAGKRFIIQTY